MPYKDTTKKDNYMINLNLQQCIYTLGRRGSGKSFCDEAFATVFYEHGITLLDLWASDNYENAFWCIPNKEGGKAFPITLLAPESLIADQRQIDRFNNALYTKEEWNKKYPDKLFDWFYPPKKPEYERGKELFRIVKLPMSTAKFDSEQNQIILKIIENTILDCRKERRIMVFNPRAFPNETQMYRTLELIIRNLNNIADKHFIGLDPKDVGKKSKLEFTEQEKHWDKMCVLFREMGELAPAREKGDRSGESVKTKKAILQFVRKARHHRISLIADWQKSTDVVDSIRQQADIWILKRYTQRLGGEEWSWVFKYIDKIRENFFIKYGRNAGVRRALDSRWPEIGDLNDPYMYVIYSNDTVKLKKVFKLKHRHKEPFDNFSKITGIKFEHDYSQIQKDLMQNATDKPKMDEGALFNVIYIMRYPKSGKKKQWDAILQKLTEMQQKGEISWSKPFNEMKPDSLRRWFNRMETKYSKPKDE